MKLIPTGKRRTTTPKGEVVVLDKDVVTEGEVRETFINAGGFFDTHPQHGGMIGLPPFRLPEANRKQRLDESYRLWKYDPLGSTIVNTTTEFTLGRGVVIDFDDEEPQFYAQKFFKKNGLKERLRNASDELSAMGEVFIWLRPHSTDVRANGKILWRTGDTQVTFIPPDNIEEIEVEDEDVGDVAGYIFTYLRADREDVVLRIPDIKRYDAATGNDMGCIIHMKVNAGNMDPFGTSDLVPIKEWLDNYQEYLRDGVIINKLYRSPCFDVSIEDGTPDEVDAAIARYRGWSIGSNPVHNSREQWQILEFSGPTSANEEARRSLLLIVAAGVGFPEFMLADGANSNLASSKSQQIPVIKKFETRQDKFADVLMQMLQFALQVKATRNQSSGLTLERDREGDFIPFPGKVCWPAITQDRDLEVAQTNQIAIADGYMSPRTAAARLNLNFEREMETMTNDIEPLKTLRKSLDEADLKIPFGGPIEEEPPMIGGEGMSGPTTTPANRSNGRGGSPDTRTRNRSRAEGGSDAPVRT